MHRVRPTTWLPLAALALLVGLTFWLNQLVQPQAAVADGKSRHDPDLMVESFNARKLGQDGRLLYTLNARKMSGPKKSARLLTRLHEGGSTFRTGRLP